MEEWQIHHRLVITLSFSKFSSERGGAGLKNLAITGSGIRDINRA